MQKMAQDKKIPTEQDALEKLQRGDVRLPPLSLELLAKEPPGAPGRRLDAVVRACWEGQSCDFGLEYRQRSTPQAFRELIGYVRDADRPEGSYPMVMVPYLSEERLRELEEQGVSGLDLCGNGIVTVPGRLLVFRTGAPNRYPYSGSIKNVYRGAASIVARAFLLRPEYAAVGEIQEEIRRRGVEIALSTVSKALKGLQEDLVVGRESGVIRLLQPEKLLDQLQKSFQPPEIRRYFHGKVLLDRDALMQRLNEQAGRYFLGLVLSGFGSANFYSVMARGETLSVYCTDLHKLLTGIPAEETDRFPNVEVVETEDETVYFDRRFKNGYPVASPVQTYLELRRGDKREQETAEQVRQEILNGLERSRT
jgi:hypothetical protein